jgi:hypothetical protein
MNKELLIYKVTPKLKKCTYSTEIWDNIICNKKVVLEKTILWRYGEFNIEIYEKEKEELLKKDHININDYGGEFICTTDGCEETFEIKNIEKYSENEKEEIYKSIYENIEEEILFDESVLEEENGWTLDDTIYEIYNGFDLELEK